MTQRIIGNFIKGVLILAPIMVTGWVIYAVFSKIDGMLGIPVPGLGFLVAILIIIAVGALASNIFFAKLFGVFERAMSRLPVVKLMYFSIKDLINSFVGEKKMFNRPVMVSLAQSMPLPGAHAMPGGDDIRLLGFVTADTLDLVPEAGDRVAVYLPQSYNMGGMMILVPRDRIMPLASTESAKLLAFIVSGGAARGPA